MNRLKTSILYIAVLAAVAFTFCGCGARNSGNSDKYSIVCTIFPEYDWVREIIGENSRSIELTLLLDNGTDLHSYQPTVADLAKVSKADLMIYVGGESDTWVLDAVSEAVNKNIKAVSLLECIGDMAVEEELMPGMVGETEDEEDEDEGPEYDEHVWLSLKNTKQIVNILTEEICAIDPKNESTYRANAKEYVAKLDALDGEYSRLIENAEEKTLLFADRFPFRYMIEDYGLKYYAAFSGCMAETEASFDTIVFLAKTLDELKIKNIFITESGDKSLANTVLNSAQYKEATIYTLDSIQSISSKDIKNGVTYLSLMENNLEVLNEALN